MATAAPLFHRFLRGDSEAGRAVITPVCRNPRQFGRNKDIDLVQITQWETPVHARIDVRPYLEIKERASACHKSQGGRS